MALKVEASETALLFKSDHYFLSILGRRVRLPKHLSPGALVVGHHDLADGKFRFSLSLKSKLFGQLIHQDAIFEDSK